MKNKRLLVFLLSLLEEEDIVHVFIFFLNKSGGLTREGRMECQNPLVCDVTIVKLLFFLHINVHSKI